MFQKITLKNFRSFDHIEFDLTLKNNTPKKLVVVYGENGAGKSNLMSAFVLLKELLNTLDVRDAYEEFLNKASLFKDKDLEESLRKRFVSNLRDINAIIEDYKMIGSDKPIIAEYEFSLNGSVGKYHIEIGKDEIIHERLEYLLNARRGIYFDCTSGDISINNGIIKDSSLLSDIKSSAKRFWGKHSMLAIMLHEMYDKASSFGWDNLHENLRNILDEFSTLSCHLNIGQRCFNDLCSPFEVLENASKGKIEKSQEHELDTIEIVLSGVFTNINPDIKKAYYKRTYEDKSINYELYFEKLIAGTYRNIPFSKESTGNHQLLKVIGYILCACLGQTVVFDEADSGIHDLLFQKLLTDIQPLIFNGQLIITTHNTLLMECDFAREAVYLITEENGVKEVKPINSIKRTYANNNIRTQYLSNGYGGIPYINSSNILPLIQAFISDCHND